MQQLADDLGSPPGAKRSYKSPRLVRFGAVRELTQAGSITSPSESAIDSNSTMPCDPAFMQHNSCPLVSDPAAKERVVRVGTHPLGIGLYLFSYRAPWRESLGSGRHFGVMADEVEAVLPAAVVRGADGYRRVDYSKLGIELARP
jgi:hypothetical protein